jgi:hypothetical protein
VPGVVPAEARKDYPRWENLCYEKEGWRIQTSLPFLDQRVCMGEPVGVSVHSLLGWGSGGL